MHGCLNEWRCGSYLKVCRLWPSGWVIFVFPKANRKLSISRNRDLEYDSIPWQYQLESWLKWQLVPRADVQIPVRCCLLSHLLLMPWVRVHIQPKIHPLQCGRGGNCPGASWSRRERIILKFEYLHTTTNGPQINNFPFLVSVFPILK